MNETIPPIKDKRVSSYNEKITYIYSTELVRNWYLKILWNCFFKLNRWYGQKNLDLMAPKFGFRITNNIFIEKVLGDFKKSCPVPESESPDNESY